MTADPVFVDRTGRRRRLMVIMGAAASGILLAVVLALLAAFSGAGPAAVPGWPGTAAGHGTAKPRSTTIIPTSRPAVTAPARSAVTTTPAPRPATTTASAPVVPTATASARPKGRAHSPSVRPSRKN